MWKALDEGKSSMITANNHNTGTISKELLKPNPVVSWWFLREKYLGLLLTIETKVCLHIFSPGMGRKIHFSSQSTSVQVHTEQCHVPIAALSLLPSEELASSSCRHGLRSRQNWWFRLTGNGPRRWAVRTPLSHRSDFAWGHCYHLSSDWPARQSVSELCGLPVQKRPGTIASMKVGSIWRLARLWPNPAGACSGEVPQRNLQWDWNPATAIHP